MSNHDYLQNSPFFADGGQRPENVDARVAVGLQWASLVKSALFILWHPHMSFLSVEPQSRVVLESHSDSLLAHIDTQLQTITDRYLAFFQERSVNFEPMSYISYQPFDPQTTDRGNLVSFRPIDWNISFILTELFSWSIDSLRKLYRKAKITDDSSKTHAEPTNTRAAWDTVRDSVEKGMCSYTLNGWPRAHRHRRGRHPAGFHGYFR